MTIAQTALVALVHGLQIACLVTWAGVIYVRGGSLWQVIVRRNESRWNRQWSSITLFAATQVGFSVRWLVFGSSMAGMAMDELAWWAVLYLSSTISAVGVVIEHGWWTTGRHRAAMILHVGVIALSILAAGVAT